MTISITTSSPPLPQVLELLNNTGAFLSVTIPPLVSGFESSQTITVPLSSAYQRALPDCSIPFTGIIHIFLISSNIIFCSNSCVDVEIGQTPSAEIHVGEIYTRQYIVRARITTFMYIVFHI